MCSIAGAGVGATPRRRSSNCEQRDKCPNSTSKHNFLRLLGFAAQRIPSSKGEQLRTPGSTKRYTHSALMPPPPLPKALVEQTPKEYTSLSPHCRALTHAFKYTHSAG